jgi:hypothetical protein
MFEIANNKPAERVARIASSFSLVGCRMLSESNLGVQIFCL